MTAGHYFGEIALLTNETRKATVTAVKPTKCLSLDRKTFKRLLGSLENKLRSNIDAYEKFVSAGKAGSDDKK